MPKIIIILSNDSMLDTTCTFISIYFYHYSMYFNKLLTNVNYTL